jgi:hypothetical protein
MKDDLDKYLNLFIAYKNIIKIQNYNLNKYFSSLIAHRTLMQNVWNFAKY